MEKPWSLSLSVPPTIDQPSLQNFFFCRDTESEGGFKSITERSQIDCGDRRHFEVAQDRIQYRDLELSAYVATLSVSCPPIRSPANVCSFWMTSFQSLEQATVYEEDPRLQSGENVWQRSVVKKTSAQGTGIWRKLRNRESYIRTLKHWTPWPESASELYRPSDRRFSAKLFHLLWIDGATWSAWRIPTAVPSVF
jgi:hypothetical protein